MQRCPIQSCGRQFLNQLTMLEHAKRRHPLQSQRIREQATNQMLQKQNKITEQMSKLPKMQKIIQLSKQKKTLQFQRRSVSKNKKQMCSILDNSQAKISDIISESRQIVGENTNSRILLKRPSLSKKSSGQMKKLPNVAQPKTKKLKLQPFKSQLNHSIISNSQKINNNSAIIEKNLSKNDLALNKESQQAMYSTAPNFTQQINKKMQLIRSRGKIDGQNTNRSSSKDLKAVNTSQVSERLPKRRLSTQNIQKLAQSQKSLQPSINKPLIRPDKKLLQKKGQRQNFSNSLITKESLAQSTFIDSSDMMAETKKQLSFKFKKKPTSKDGQQFVKKSQQKSSIVQSEKKQKFQIDDVDWNQRTVTIKNKKLKEFQIPEFAQVQSLYIKNCHLNTIELKECFSLRQLTITSCNLQSLSFLQPTINGSFQNLESLFFDFNLLVSISSLPTYLPLHQLSLTFNKIEGLDDLLKILVKLPHLQSLDLSFNPVRKQANYKLAVLTACKNLKKLDGMLVTKLDRQMAVEYNKIYFDCLHIIPLSLSPTSSGKFRPSTAVSINYQDQQFQRNDPLSEMTQQQLSKQIQTLEKIIQNTKIQFQIIQKQNKVLQDEISSYEPDFARENPNEDDFNPKVYKKLCKQVEELELLNFLQFASEKELEEILHKKVVDKGLDMQILAGL